MAVSRPPLYTDLLPYELRELLVDFLYTTVVYHQSTAFYEGDRMTCDTGGTMEEREGNGLRFIGAPIPFCWNEQWTAGTPWFPRIRQPWSVTYLNGKVTVRHRWWHPAQEMFAEETQVMLRLLMHNAYNNFLQQSNGLSIYPAPF